MTVDVVIPVHGQWELTARCLDSLRVRDACVRRVIVVDDASPDETARCLAERDDVEVVRLNDNRGFATACNAGAARADADAIFFLNNDTIVERGTIDRLAAALAKRGIGAVMPKLVNGDGTLQCAGLALLEDSDRFVRLHAYLDAEVPEGNVAYDPIALSGAALLVRREAFVAAGSFDDGYRNGFEDADLCATLWSLGYRCRYEPAATLLHLEGASRGKILDDDANARRFATRWGAKLREAPRYREPAAPLLAFSWHSKTVLEQTIGAHLTATLRAHAGARVVRTPFASPVLAALDRRPRVRLTFRDRDACDALWCAPVNFAEARRFAGSRAPRFWVPSRRAAATLAEAGVTPNRIAVVRLAWAAVGDAPQVRDETFVVAREAATAARLIERLRVRVTAVVADAVDAAMLARIRRAAVVAFADEGDAWGAVGSAALSGGAVVIAPHAAPFLEIVPPDVWVLASSLGDVVDAVRAAHAEPEATRARGAYAARMMARILPDVNAGRRVRELARALVHGVVDPRSLAVDRALLTAPVRR